jgi:hypothetical protein
MSLFQTEKLPEPAIVDAVVDVDSDSRTLAVRLSEREGGWRAGKPTTLPRRLQRLIRILPKPTVAAPG